MMNDKTRAELCEEAATELRRLLWGPKAPKTSRGRDSQTAKKRGPIIQIFWDLSPDDIKKSDKSYEVVHSLVDMVWEREYLMSSQGDRVVQEMTDFPRMCQKYLILCDVALMGKNLLGPKSTD